MSRLSHSNASALSLPRAFPSSGFERIDSSSLVEEERLPFYRRQDYYPMRIGQFIQGNYQVVAKLGYGTTSTVWLSRDLR
jgi:serine/threonine-protein kinase SRPK3